MAVLRKSGLTVRSRGPRQENSNPSRTITHAQGDRLEDQLNSKHQASSNPSPRAQGHGDPPLDWEKYRIRCLDQSGRLTIVLVGGKTVNAARIESSYNDAAIKVTSEIALKQNFRSNQKG